MREHRPLVIHAPEVDVGWCVALLLVSWLDEFIDGRLPALHRQGVELYCGRNVVH